MGHTFEVKSISKNFFHFSRNFTTQYKLSKYLIYNIFMHYKNACLLKTKQLRKFKDYGRFLFLNLSKKKLLKAILESHYFFVVPHKHSIYSISAVFTPCNIFDTFKNYSIAQNSIFDCSFKWSELLSYRKFWWESRKMVFEVGRFYVTLATLVWQFPFKIGIFNWLWNLFSLLLKN